MGSTPDNGEAKSFSREDTSFPLDSMDFRLN
jgi:hypothetical protein